MKRGSRTETPVLFRWWNSRRIRSMFWTSEPVWVPPVFLLWNSGEIRDILLLISVRTECAWMRPITLLSKLVINKSPNIWWSNLWCFFDMRWDRICRCFSRSLFITGLLSSNTTVSGNPWWKRKVWWCITEATPSMRMYGNTTAKRIIWIRISMIPTAKWVYPPLTVWYLTGSGSSAMTEG